MRKYALRLRHLWLYLNSEWVWSQHVKFIFPQLKSLQELKSLQVVGLSLRIFIVVEHKSDEVIRHKSIEVI